MSFILKIVEQEKNGAVLLAAEGAATAMAFPSADCVLFDDILGPDWSTRGVVVDMDQVHYLDSSAIGWLLNSRKLFRDSGGHLVLHSLQPQVRQVLDMLKIGHIIPLAADVKAARALLAPAPAKAAVASR